MNYNVYAGILKIMDKFKKGEDIRGIKYLNNKGCEELREKYNLYTVAGAGDNLSKALNLLNWISTHIYYDGDYNSGASNAIDILEYAFDNGKDKGVNCRTLSVALVECCQAINLIARTVYIMPCSPYESENHVVCEVWIQELNKWIMLDPTYNGYIKDKDSNILNVFELRSVLSNEEQIILSDNFNLEIDVSNIEEVKAYYAKDLFFILIKEIQTFNSEGLSNNPYLAFVPDGFDVKRWFLVDFDYRSKDMEDEVTREKIRQTIKNINIVYSPIEKIMEAPKGYEVFNE